MNIPCEGGQFSLPKVPQIGAHLFGKNKTNAPKYSVSFDQFLMRSQENLVK